MNDETGTDLEAQAALARELLARVAEESGEEPEAYPVPADVIEGLRALCERLEQRYKNLDTENYRAIEMAVDVEEKNRRLAQVNAKSAELYAELEEKKQAVESANIDLAKANARSAELMGELELKNSENDRLNAALARANAQAAELMADLEEKNEQLRKSMAEIKTLQGIVPICAHCKQIRDDEGYWEQVEKYFARHSELAFSHGICPQCYEKYYSEYLTDEDRKEMGLKPKPPSS